MRWMMAVFLLAAVAASTAAEPASQPTREQADSQTNRRALEALLPAPGKLAGCTCSADHEFFHQENLWDYINGEADTYVRYGFRLLLVAECMATGDSSLTIIEIYRMESPLHAFGIYSAERFADDVPVDAGVEGYIGEHLLNFWKGPYYVKMAAHQSTSATRETLRRFAESVDAAIAGEYDTPEPLKSFPTDGRVERSERFIPDSFLGHPFLPNGYLVEYQRQDNRYQLFLSELPSPEAAGEAFSKFRAFLRTENEHPSVLRRSGHQHLWTDSGGGKLVFQYKSYVCGVLGLSDFGQASESADSLFTNLRGIEKLYERRTTDRR